ncbi:DUF6638 family protein [Jannaschia aquimarina]|uniref:Uncharacterized protein n=1 Tax=Jannaschia aquimarina TaxID=935700 RepID=A0A0D1CNY4_9RHOB|nr:DUF6638 family protein [Jannaschia aquimarina]KIT16472.1 hypothetical protein jaqu_17000 [Jannaschia aquimarina]SNT07737.1 hypothetical protein SAMN05421775_105146 [Jannaschia aquimarina]
MHRLITSGLMFGGLFHVAAPALVERYNRALDHLTGRRTELEDFHVDLSGFSPEIGDEFEDMDYLNPGGCNRQFILLSTRQADAPLLEMKFSNSADILREFIAANEAQLFTLTARDAVAGELQNSVWSVADPERLLDIRRVTVEADTTSGTVRDAETLDALIRRFRTEPDAWWDDVLVAKMIDLARRTGDVTRAPVTFENPSFEAQDFWTSHHGGLYVLRSVPKPAILARAMDREILGDLPVHALSDRGAVAGFLRDNALAQPIVEGRGPDAVDILREKMDILAIDALAQGGHLPETPDPRALRRATTRHADALPPAFHSLARVLSWAEGRGDWPRIDSDDPAYFHTLRGAPGPLRDKVNMMLAEIGPEDFRQLHICHKSAFYARYAAMPEMWKAWVANNLATGYAGQTADVWRRLYASDAVPRMPKVPLREGWPIRREGPWD